MILKNILHKIISVVFKFLVWPFAFFLKHRPVIILQTYSRQIYCENTKYLFEHLSKNTDYEVYWATENTKIQEYIESKGWRYVTRRKFWHMLLKTAQADMVIDSGSQYYNFFGLVPKRAIKITTLHGCGPKATIATTDTLKENLDEVFNMNSFDYVNFTSQYAAVMIGKLNVKLPHHKAIALGYPRCDLYFNRAKVEEAFAARSMIKKIVPQYQSGEKVILYTPTWRPYDYEFPLHYMQDFDQKKLEDFLERTNSYLIYTFHSINLPKSSLQESARIKFLHHRDDPFFDINLFMLEVDVLLNDYSTTSTEFALLGRPQVFFMPDYDHYFDYKGFIEDYKAIMPGTEVTSMAQFLTTLTDCFSRPQDYAARHQAAKEKLLQRYYDVNLANACGRFSDFIAEKLGVSPYCSKIKAAKTSVVPQ